MLETMTAQIIFWILIFLFLAFVIFMFVGLFMVESPYYGKRYPYTIEYQKRERELEKERER